ncbi:HAD family hydrolase [Frankia sp. Ag45/Mut15]|uniref:HAD family hydrolase n=1 Tax=Frankia umida TaxID=573489 RepID=A0ABT0K588_9ACTN|nr:HAD family hydrolase [Frankia umida]MCK9878945.1 HAD family hydrolase [Frankia umida]
MVRAVSFDVDDTLIDYSVSIPRSLRGLFGTDADPDVWLTLMDALHPLYLDGTLSHTAYLRTRMAAMLTTLGRPVPDDAALDRMEQQRITLAETGLRLYPDVLPCLTTLRAEGMPLALLSNTDGRLQRRRLQVVGLTGLFDIIALSGEIGVAKPNPAAFEHVSASLGLTTADVVHVGDNPAADAQGALAAGNPMALLIDRTGRHPTPAGVTRIMDLREVPDLLRGVR